MKTKSLDAFTKWAKYSSAPIVLNEKECVAYTRVSSKEQQQKNLSLVFQKRYIEEYTTRHNLHIQEYFGGKFESAKTDGRKEFQRMLEYIRTRKGRIKYILVYSTSRFSRTGGGAIKLAKDLRDKYGVHILAVTQPTDTSKVSGIFHQNVNFLFSEYDNQVRRQGAIDGSVEKLLLGIWCLKPPMGYDSIYTNNERKIIINKVGQHLRKAFHWKAEGMANEEILQRLKALGVTIYKQKLSMIFSNPFYAGVIVNKMLNGEVKKGIHPALVSEELFLRVNNVRAAAKGKYGILHEPKKDMLPLKVFTKCDKCGNGYTGYIVKAKNIHYYKCRTNGCKCNQNAARMNDQFLTFLSEFCIRQELIAPLQACMKEIFNRMNNTNEEEQKELAANLKETEKYLDNINEKYFVLEVMDAPTYQKMSTKYTDKKLEILNAMERCKKHSSNLYEFQELALKISANAATAWSSSLYSQRELIQKVIFPEGVYYNLENEAFRTERVNEVFQLIPRLNCISGGEKERQEAIFDLLSCQVGTTGFELECPSRHPS